MATYSGTLYVRPNIGAMSDSLGFGDLTYSISYNETTKKVTVSASLEDSVISGNGDGKLTLSISVGGTTLDSDTKNYRTLNETLSVSGSTTISKRTYVEIALDTTGGNEYFGIYNSEDDFLDDNDLNPFTVYVGEDEEEEEPTSNNPPVISGSNTNLGTFTLTPPSAYSYTVTDPENNSVTVKETFDGTTVRTFTATLGASNTFQIDAATWLRTLNGSHTINITATDSKGASATRALTFTKNVTSLSFTLETPLDADDQITKGVESIIAAIPDGATITVEVCNNGYDAEPTWEDVTQRVLKGEKFFFGNAQKTAANWGYNVRVNVTRNNATGDCYVVSMTGFFE